LPSWYDGVGDTLVVFNWLNPGNSSIVIIGQHFFSDFLPFELASILVMIGAIILARQVFYQSR